MDWLIDYLIDYEWLIKWQNTMGRWLDGLIDYWLTCFDQPISVLHFQTTLIYILQYHAKHGIDWLID